MSLPKLSSAHLPTLLYAAVLILAALGAYHLIHRH